MNAHWDLTRLYKDDAAYEADLEKLRKEIDLLPPFKGTLGQDEKLKAFFDIQVELELLVNRLYAYAASKADLNRKDVSNVSRENELVLLLRQLESATSYFEPEILSLGREHMDSFFQRNKEYDQFDFQIRKLFDRESHVLSDDKEKLLSDFSAFHDVGDNLYSTLSVGDYRPKKARLSDGREVEVTTANWTTLIAEEKKAEDRKSIFEALYRYYDEHKNTYAEIYSFLLQSQLAEMKARGYSSILEEHLDKNRIPTSVFFNLVEVARKGSQPLQRYYELRRKALHLDKHRSYDRFLSLTESKKKVTYEESKEMFFRSIEKFPEDFRKKARKVTMDGMVDVYPQEGKTTGAYSRGGGGLEPMILLNFQGTLEDVFTLAHESGHSIHTLYSDESQPLMKQNYTIFVAEIASTFNEHNLLDDLLQRGELTREDKIALLQKAIDEICGTFYRQTLFGEFEYLASQRAQRGEPINYQVLSDIMTKLYKDYYGIDIAEEVYKPLVWCYIPHLYGTPFYVYQYATSFSASLELYSRVKKGQEHAFEDYVSLLRQGGSDYPIEEVRKAGVDLTTKEPFEAVVCRMEELVDLLERELGRE